MSTLDSASDSDSDSDNKTPRKPFTLRAIFGVGQVPGLRFTPTGCVISGHVIPVHKAEYRAAILCKGVLVNRALRRTVEITNRGLPAAMYVMPNAHTLSLGDVLACTDPTFPDARYDGQVLFHGPNTVRLTFLKPFTYTETEPPYLHIDLPHLLGWYRRREAEIQQTG